MKMRVTEKTTFDGMKVIHWLFIWDAHALVTGDPITYMQVAIYTT